MSGPTLQLNITAPGQKSVEASVSAVERLAAALRDIPKASAELAKLQKALAGVQAAPSGLASGAGELKELVQEIKNLGAQLNNSFGSLEETIKKGWTRAAKAEQEGAEKAAAAATAGRNKRATISYQTQAMRDEGVVPKAVDLKWFASLQTGTLKLEEAAKAAAARETAAVSDWRRTVELNSAKLAEAYRLSGEKWQRAVELNSAKMAEAGRLSEANWRRTLELNSAKMAETYRLQREKERTANLEAAAAKAAGYDEMLVRLNQASNKVAAAAKERAGKEAAAILAASAKKAEADKQWLLGLQLSTAKLTEAYRVGEAKKQADSDRWLRNLQITSAKMAEASRLAGEQEAAAILAAAKRVTEAAKVADARYASMSPRAQARAVLTARSRLDRGVDPEDIRAGLGSTALAAAQMTSAAEAYAKAHPAVEKVHRELQAGKPKIEGYTRALGDMHSGLRGVASGFGQMSLTWGSIGPLLAGAALSQSFVESIKQGAQVRQDLEAMRVLSNESAAAIRDLEASLSSLARTGPFAPREIAEAMKTLSLAGLSAADVGKALKPTLDFAITGGVGINKAAESLVAIGTAYGYQADQFSTVADAVSKAAAISMSSVEGMMESFRASSIVAQAYGVSLKDAATAQALLANIGIRGSAAGTAMRQMYSELSGATASTREAMRRLGVEVVDQQGKMKPLLTIMLDLSKALSTLSGPARISAIQALSNERGSKSIVAGLVAVEQKAKEVGSTASNELERIRELIETSEGFNAIAAAQLAATPLNLLKGVSASFQDALLDAFKKLEPVLVTTASKLREVFNSPEFRDGVVWLVTAMGRLVTVIVENVSALKTLAIAYAAFKGFQLLQLSMSAAAVALGLLNKELVFTSSGIVTAGTAAAAAAPAVNRLAAAAGGLSLALRFIGPIGIALTVAATAWELYSSKKSEAQQNEEANAKKHDLTLTALEEEAKRLDAITVELRKGTDARYAEIKAKEAQAQADRNLEDEKQRAPLRSQLASAKRLYDESVLRGDSPAVRAIRKQDMDTASQRFTAFNQQAREREEAIAFQQQVVKSLQNEVNQRKGLQETKPTLGTGEWESAKDLAAAMNRNESELALLKKNFDAQQQEAQTAYRRQMELLDLQHKAKLISEGQYATQSLQYSDSLHQTELQNLEKYIQDSKSLIAKLKADPKKNVKGQSYIDEIALDQRQMEAQYDHLKKLGAAKEAANLGGLGVKTSDELSKLEEAVALQEAKNEADWRTIGLTPSLVAAENAIADARSKGAAAIKPLVDEVVRAQLALNAAEAELLNSPVYGDFGEGGQQGDNVEKLRRRLELLKVQLADAQARVNTNASKAGAAAGATGPSAWERFVAEGQNAQTVLAKSRDAFMQGWVDSGRTIWETWLTTGKASLSSLKQLFMKTLADITYQMLIVKPFSDLGSKLFGTTLAPAVDLAGGKDFSAVFSGLVGPAGALGAAFTSAGLRLEMMLTATGNGLANLLAGAGAGEGGGLLGALAKGFLGGGGGGSGSASTGDNPWGTDIVLSALGSAFNGPAQLFAAGAVFDSPRAFRFGKGASKLGIMGEAGPEAIMPLTRGAGGELGVRAVGAQKAGGTSIVIENYGNGEQPQVTRETKPDGSELIRVVLNATAKDIARGGAVRKSVQGAVKTTPNLPRY